VIEYLSQIAILFLINTILASSLNIINGFCGLFSLGHAGFFAVGAYTGALMSMGPLAGYPDVVVLVVACIAGMLAAGLAGLLVGIPCLRLTGDYLAIATVGFGEIIRIVLLNLDLVGGARGMPGIPRLTTLPLALVFSLLSIFLIRNFMRSSYGRSIIAIREDEIAARSSGVNVRYHKTFAFVLGSSFAGLAGVLFAHYQEFLHPSNFSFLVTVSVLLMIVVGGLGSLRGAVLGALVVTVLPELLRFQETLSQIRMLVFGLVMILVMLAQPQGLMGLLRRKKAAV
jgi:branched-chain amino acid transport system permease protein